MKRATQIILVWVMAFGLCLGVESWMHTKDVYWGNFVKIPFAMAEEDDDEDEDREDEDDDKKQEDNDDKKETVTTVRYEVRPVTQQVVVTPPEYLIDTDGDLLVDGVDPDPRVHQREYFTDNDDDGIANVFDRHPNEDDFSYYSDDEDANMNGIIDSYETVDTE